MMGITHRAIKNITRRKTRALLVIIALSLSMALMISIPAGLAANENATKKITDDYVKSNNQVEVELNKTTTLIEIANQTSDSITFSSSISLYQMPCIDKETYDQIKTLPNVKDILPFFDSPSNETVPSTINLGGRNITLQKSAYTTLGIPLDYSLINNYKILPQNITAGRNLQENDHNVAVISEDLISYFNANVGDKITINGKQFTIVGICGSSDGVSRVFMNILDAQELFNKNGQASRVEVYANDVSNVDEISEAIKAINPNIRVTSYKDRLSSLESIRQSQQQILNNAQATLAQTQATARQEIVIIVVATSIIVFFVMLYTVRERTKEIGTLKAIGFSNGVVMSQFMLEGIILSSVAGAIGIGIGFFVAPLISGLLLPYVNPLAPTLSGGTGGFTVASIGQVAPPLTVTLTPELIVLSMGVAVLLGALGSLYPAWKAAKTRPALAMKYE
jgi:putative ABC transport system permease protein